MGPVGIGKTAVVREVAENWKLPVLELHIGEAADPSDITGIPVPQDNKILWLLSEMMMGACSTPTMLFLDEIDKGQPAIQNGVLSLVGKRSIRGHVLHPDTLIVCAGNRLQDDEFSNQLSAAMKSRVTIIQVEPNLKAFGEWGRDTNNIHPLVLGYLQYRPEHLHKVSAETPRFPTPRSWKEVSDQLQVEKEQLYAVIVGEKVGHAVGNDFLGWYEIVRKVDISRLLEEGIIDGVGMDAHALQYAAVFALCNKLNTTRIKPAMTGLPIFLELLSPEMQVAFLMQLQVSKRAEIASVFPGTATKIMNNLIS
jgi:hypothetical protein